MHHASRVLPAKETPAHRTLGWRARQQLQFTFFFFLPAPSPLQGATFLSMKLLAEHMTRVKTQTVLMRICSTKRSQHDLSVLGTCSRPLTLVSHLAAQG